MATQTPPQLRRKPTAVDTVRGGPRTSYKKVAGINAGTDYKILSKYHTGQSGDIGTWWQIERPDPDIDSKWEDNVDSGWVRGNNVVIEGDVSGVRVTWQPYTATLRRGSLALPFVPDPEVGVIRITTVFDDLRTRDDYTDYGGGHNGIDWAMAGTVYAMAAGRVAEIVTGQPEKDESAGYGNRVIVQSPASGSRMPTWRRWRSPRVTKSSLRPKPEGQYQARPEEEYAIGDCRPDRLLHRRASPCAPGA